MTVREFNRDQLIQLKQSYLTRDNTDVSYGELAEADNLVDDETIFDEYGNTIFSEEDFL